VQVVVQLCALLRSCKFASFAAQQGVTFHRLWCDAGPAHITGEVTRLETNRSKIKAEGGAPSVTLPWFVTFLSDETSTHYAKSLNNSTPRLFIRESNSV
jgi:hypothetical protein